MHPIAPPDDCVRALRVKEAARRYRVSKSHLYNLMNDGKLRSVCVGRARLIPVEEMESLLRHGA